jgi:hypothetical protein
VWIVYTAISCGMLRVFVFYPLELPGRIIGIVFFAMFTALILIAVILLSSPRSFWGRMKPLILKKDSPNNTQKRRCQEVWEKP